MKTVLCVLAASAAVCVPAAFVAVSFTQAQPEDDPKPQAKPPGAKEAPAAPTALEAKGYVIPVRQVTVRPVEVSGQIVAFEAVEGKHYGKGDTLAKIDPTIYETAEAEAKATLVGAEKRLSAAKEADAAVLGAEVTAAKARLKQAQWRLDNCVVKAPFAGTVLTKKTDLGGVVNPMTYNADAICEMADLSCLEVEIKVAEQDIAKLKVGQKCRIVPTAYPDREYAGTLNRILPIADRATTSLVLRVKVVLPPDEEKTPGEFLKPDMQATVRFQIDRPK